ncbi:hypothetical protein [Piscinibacter sp. XHJ-5]|uniref:hypothetical protein n=1 Tax=Piscinibacter sp. XHJ-5 TaxID=3037797 RepID=UPI00245338F8|nr:hypothetical protein [Piscinibacter sp. XHJ-5]
MNAKSPPSKPQPIVPDSLPIADALQRSAPLTHLRQRLQDSNARLAAIRDLLPAALALQVKAGPVDEESWSLLVANASSAAKLRQLLPRLEVRLRERGWQSSSIRIRVQSS